MNLNSDSLINTDHYCYFRPSFVKAKREIEFEMQDYKKFKNHVTMDTYRELLKVEHTAPRVRYVNKRMRELEIEEDEPNYNDIMRLLGVEHKYQCSLKEVDDFIGMYKEKILNCEASLKKFRNRLALKMRWGSRFEQVIIPLLGELSEAQTSLSKWQEECETVSNLLMYIRNKIILKKSF